MLATAFSVATTAVAIEQEEIERRVNAKQIQLVSCYEDAQARNENLPKGKIVTRYTIEEDGTVSSAKIVRNDLRDTQLGECVRQVFLSLDYGAQDKKTNVTYPLTFE